MGNSYNNTKMTALKVEGYVAPGYETIKKIFTEHFQCDEETQAQLCVYVGETRVVDLWGSMDPSIPYTGDTLNTIFSSTKNLTSLAMAMMVDRGRLSYQDKIAQHWPQFGQEGKDKITVADLMRHEAGIPTIDMPLDPEDLIPENIKKNKVGQVLEKQVPIWPSKGKREYHSITRGWIANEVFRRVHQTGMTIGEFIKAEVAQPLGTNGIVVGVSDEDVSRYQNLAIRDETPKYPISDSAKKPHFKTLEDDKIETWNSELIRRGETPSANGNCSARGLAKVGAVLANKGKFDNVTLLTPTTWEAFHSGATLGDLFGYQVLFTEGGVASFKGDEVTDGFYGWSGYGGSCFQWNPELGVSFAYIPCLLQPSISSTDEKYRARPLQAEVVRCARESKTSP